jgi:hypothetical protein
VTDTTVEVHQQVAGLLGVPRTSGMTGRAEDVDVATADFQCEEHVDPFQGDRAVDARDARRPLRLLKIT